MSGPHYSPRYEPPGITDLGDLSELTAAPNVLFSAAMGAPSMSFSSPVSGGNPGGGNVPSTGSNPTPVSGVAGSQVSGPGTTPGTTPAATTGPAVISQGPGAPTAVPVANHSVHHAAGGGGGAPGAVSTPSVKGLPFTGYAAAAIGMIGSGLMGAGAIVRRLSRRSS